jgi:hypothetical protein
LALMVLAFTLSLPAPAFAQFGFDNLNFPPVDPGGPLPPGHLDNTTPLGRGGRSLGFLSGVGGVAFGATANLDPGVEISALTYDLTAVDGERLRVTLHSTDGTTQVAVSPIADWLLVPVARFASGSQDAAFTLFGQASTEEETARQRAAGNDILNYHPMFADTLVGLRLMHADILILYGGAAELPTLDGTTVLGSGEQPGDVESNTNALVDVQEYMLTLPGHPISVVRCRGFRADDSCLRRGRQARISGQSLLALLEAPHERPSSDRRGARARQLLGQSHSSA